MNRIEELSPEALFDLDEIEALPAFNSPDFMADAPTFTETETSSATTCTYSVMLVNENPYDGVFSYAQSPLGLRVVNSSGQTIPVVVNENLPNGKQEPQEILNLPPGGDTDVLKPGWDTDGIFPPGDNNRVIKLIDNVVAEVLPSGSVRFPWYNNPINTGLQFIFGGWEDEQFLNQWKWPRPDSNKCQK